MEVSDKLVNDIKDCLQFTYKDDFGREIKGIIESGLQIALRGKGWKNIPHRAHFASHIRAMGFNIKPAKSGKWTTAGFKYCQPCRIVTLE